MDRGRKGLILTQLLAVLSLASIALMTVGICYREAVSLMLTHNKERQAFEIAQREMLIVKAAGSKVGISFREEGVFAIQIVVEAELPGGLKRIEVSVGEKDGALCLANLVQYE